MSRLRSRLVDAAVALSLAIVYVVALLRSASTLGYARDEAFYFQAATSYGRWFEALFKNRAAAMAPAAVDAAWGVNHEHPGLVKSLFALSNLILQGRWHLFAMEGTSYRFPTMVLSGGLVALVYLWGAQARGRVVGLAAAALLAAMPRFFYHAHLACFDAPIVAMWTLCVYAWWRALRDGGLLWPLLTGVAFGLALDTKHNAWFLPFLLVTHTGVLELRALIGPRIGIHVDPAAHRAVRRRALATLAVLAVVGPAVFYALWPWIWHGTAKRLRDYAAFHLGHEYYNMEFLGENYWKPPMPRAYPWVMTAATVPAVTLLLFAVGAATRARVWLAEPARRLAARLRRRAVTAGRGATIDAAGLDLLWIGGLAISYAAWVSPTTPIFGGTKHWMTAYPFLALFAGVGVDAVVRAARRELLLRRRGSDIALRLGKKAFPVAALVLAAVLAAPIAETAHSHPWGLSSYTPLVGGAAGGASLGLNRTFWGYTTGAVVGFLDAEAPRGASVYLHDTLPGAWEMLQRDGRLRRDLRGAWSIVGADFGLYHHEKHLLGMEYENWLAFGTSRPAHIGGLDGVPVIVVYKHPRVAAKAR